MHGCRLACTSPLASLYVGTSIYVYVYAHTSYVSTACTWTCESIQTCWRCFLLTSAMFSVLPDGNLGLPTSVFTCSAFTYSKAVAVFETREGSERERGPRCGSLVDSRVTGGPAPHQSQKLLQSNSIERRCNQRLRRIEVKRSVCRRASSKQEACIIYIYI